MKPGQRVIVALRTMIASGELPDGERIAEIPTAERLGVSRMPVRTALRALEQEGLVVRIGARGYAARGPTHRQVGGAVEVRGVLEGLAARKVAERADHADVAARLSVLVDSGEAIFAEGRPGENLLENFYAYNLAFHDLLIAECGNEAIGVALARNNHLPFASASAIALDRDDQEGFARLLGAHGEHRAVVAAIAAGDADGAERLMRRHALQATAASAAFERLGTEAVSG